MKNRNIDRICFVLLNLVFLALFGLALGANRIGLDEGPAGWGVYRKTFFFIGASGLLFSLLLMVSEKIEKKILHRCETSGDELKQKRASSNAGSKKTPLIASLGLILAVEILYVGFISVWNWDHWPSTTRFYGLLGEAFIQGKTDLPIEPSPLLANLDNPYLTSERDGIPVETDLSYYNQKYYMYWGPAPALVAALAILLTGQIPGDELIIFLSISAAFFFSFRIIQSLKKRFFPSVPGWLFTLSILSIAASFPFLWILNSPDIYGAAIASGQAFLLGGLYFALPVLGGYPSPRWRTFLAGVFWIFAIGSRLILAVPVAALLLGICIQLLLQTRASGNGSKAISTLAVLALPMLAGSIGLGLYNYARFGNFLETGLRYSLNPHDLWLNLPKGVVFNPRYFLSNLLYYFFAPIRAVASFPFLKPIWGPIDRFARLLAPMGVPSIYTIENSAGLLFTTPTLLFAGYLIKDLVKGLNFGALKRKILPEPDPGQDFNANARFTLGFILLAGIAASLPILTYFYVSCRYTLDFMPLLNIFIVAGMWQLFRVYNPFPIRRWLIHILILTVVISTVGVGLLLALTGAQDRFDDFNPGLYQALLQFFQ